MTQQQDIPIRQLDRERMRGLLRYGDIGKIAIKTPYHYQYVSQVIRDLRDNDKVWEAVATYLDELPKVRLSKRLSNQIRETA